MTLTLISAAKASAVNRWGFDRNAKSWCYLSRCRDLTQEHPLCNEQTWARNFTRKLRCLNVFLNPGTLESAQP